MRDLERNSTRTKASKVIIFGFGFVNSSVGISIKFWIWIGERERESERVAERKVRWPVRSYVSVWPQKLRSQHFYNKSNMKRTQQTPDTHSEHWTDLVFFLFFFRILLYILFRLHLLYVYAHVRSEAISVLLCEKTAVLAKLFQSNKINSLRSFQACCIEHHGCFYCYKYTLNTFYC